MSRRKRRRKQTGSREQQLDRRQQGSSGRAGGSWKFPAAAVLVICLLGAIIYSHTLRGPFVFDDKNNIEGNPFVRVTELDFRKLYDAGAQSLLPRPVAYISFALNYYFGGYDVTGYHLVNIAIHLVNGILVYFLASVTFRLDFRNQGREPVPAHDRAIGWMSLFAACIFIAHPLQTQAVTYIVQRMTSIAAMFYLLSLLLYIHGRLSRERPKRWLLWAGCLVSGLLALGSKEIAVTLPLVIVLYQWYFFEDLSYSWARRRLRYLLGLVVVLGLVALIFVGSSPWQHILAGYEKRDFTMGERVLTQFRVVIHYISLVLFPLPSRLNLIPNISTSRSLLEPITTLFSLLTVTGLGGLAVYLARRQRLISFCIVWFLVNLVLESSVIALEMVYEHRLYLPMFAFALIVPYIVYRLLSTRVVVAGLVSVLVIMVLGWGTYVRNLVWQDEAVLWSDVMSNPQSHRAYFHRGIVHGRLGKHDLAMTDYAKAIELQPNYAKAYNNRGIIYAQLGKHELAIADYAKAIGSKPDLAPAYNNRGIVHGRLGKHDLAMTDYAKAIELQPDYVPAYYNRGNVYKRLSKHDLAITDYAKVIELQPDCTPAYKNRGNTYTQLGKHNLAIADYEKAIELQPDYALASNSLAWLLATSSETNLRDGKRAVEYARRVCEMTGWKAPDYLDTLAAACAENGDFAEAVRWQTKATELTPSDRKPEMLNRLRLYRAGKPYRQGPNK